MSANLVESSEEEKRFSYSDPYVVDTSIALPTKTKVISSRKFWRTWRQQTKPTPLVKYHLKRPCLARERAYMAITVLEFYNKGFIYREITDLTRKQESAVSYYRIDAKLR